MSTRFELPARDLERIRALLAVKDSTDFAGEAANAAALAAQILQKYNLSQAEFEKDFDTSRPEQNPMIFTSYTIGTEPATVLPTWIAILVSAVKHACFCEALLSNRGMDILFVGRKREADTAVMIFGSLFSQMNSRVLIEMKHTADQYRHSTGKSYWEIPGCGNPHKQKRDYMKSWLFGCAQGIADVMMKEFQQTVQANSTGTGLMVVRDQENKDFIQKNLNPSGKMAKTTKNDVNHSALSNGYSAGHELGRNIQQKKLEG